MLAQLSVLDKFGINLLSFNEQSILKNSYPRFNHSYTQILKETGMTVLLVVSLMVCLIFLPFMVNGYAYAEISKDPNGCVYKKGNITKLYPAGKFRPSPELCEICDCSLDNTREGIYKYIMSCEGCGVYLQINCKDLIEKELPYPQCCSKPACWLHE